jgi:predicted DNA-binding transcriptional regulator YafY
VNIIFTDDEIEAILAGLCSILEDEESPLYDAASEASDKIMALLPEPPSGPPDFPEPVFADPAAFVRFIRSAVECERRLRIQYRDAKGRDSARTIWPILEPGSEEDAVAAWCERRQDFRNFRIDRIQSLQVLDRYPTRRQVLLARWQLRHGDDWY